MVAFITRHESRGYCGIYIATIQLGSLGILIRLRDSLSEKSSISPINNNHEYYDGQLAEFVSARNEPVRLSWGCSHLSNSIVHGHPSPQAQRLETAQGSEALLDGRHAHLTVGKREPDSRQYFQAAGLPSGVLQVLSSRRPTH